MPKIAIRRGPTRSTRIPVRGAISPASNARIEYPIVMTAAPHPVESWIGEMNTAKPKLVIPPTMKFVVAPAPAMYQP